MTDRLGSRATPTDRPPHHLEVQEELYVPFEAIMSKRGHGSQRSQDGYTECLAATSILDREDSSRLSYKEIQESYGSSSNFFFSHSLKPWDHDDQEEALAISRALKSDDQQDEYEYGSASKRTRSESSERSSRCSDDGSISDSHYGGESYSDDDKGSDDQGEGDASSDAAYSDGGSVAGRGERADSDASEDTYDVGSGNDSDAAASLCDSGGAYSDEVGDDYSDGGDGGGEGGGYSDDGGGYSDDGGGYSDNGGGYSDDGGGYSD